MRDFTTQLRIAQILHEPALSHLRVAENPRVATGRVARQGLREWVATIVVDNKFGVAILYSNVLIASSISSRTSATALAAFWNCFASIVATALS